MEGTAHDLQLSWSALKTGVLDEEDEKKEEKENRSELSVFYPEGTYGLENNLQRESQSILVQNTTVWTCGNQGILLKMERFKK